MKKINKFDYTINEDGYIYNKNNKKIKSYITNKGYVAVQLKRDKKRYHKLVHRLVAETYIPNPNNKPQVNHINGNKTDNRVGNLEWVTAEENVNHRQKNGLGRKRAVRCIELNKIYNRIIDVVVDNFNPSGVVNCIKKRRNNETF